MTNTTLVKIILECTQDIPEVDTVQPYKEFEVKLLHKRGHEVNPIELKTRLKNNLNEYGITHIEFKLSKAKTHIHIPQKELTLAEVTH